MIRRGFSLVLGWALLATACAGEAEPATTRPPADPTGIAWELESGKVDGMEMTLVEGFPVTLNIDGEDASGTAACNGYGSSVSISGSEIEFGELAWTAMGCSPDAVMTLESKYLEALPRVTAYSGGSVSLSLTGEGVELDYTPLAPAPLSKLTGAVWVLESLIRGEAVSGAEGRATLELFTDGSMLGSTGCRSLHGRYVVDGAEVVMTEMSAEGQCVPDMQDQDNRVITVLGDGFRASVDGQIMTLTSMGGLGLVYRAES